MVDILTLQLFTLWKQLKCIFKGELIITLVNEYDYQDCL